jgi:hypothetical protein
MTRGKKKPKKKPVGKRKDLFELRSLYIVRDGERKALPSYREGIS